MKIHTLVCGELGENCYIAGVGREKAVIVDPGEDGKRIYDKTAALGLSVCAILLTHGHFDHIGGLRELYHLTGADVYIHVADQPMLKDPDLNLSLSMNREDIVADIPVKALYGGETLAFGDTGFSVLHTPGHSEGSVCYMAGDDVFTGDTAFSVGYGRTDFPGGSFLELRNSIRLLKNTISGKTIYPGHGEPKIF